MDGGKIKMKQNTHCKYLLTGGVKPSTNGIFRTEVNYVIY